MVGALPAMARRGNLMNRRATIAVLGSVTVFASMTACAANGGGASPVSPSHSASVKEEVLKIHDPQNFQPDALSDTPSTPSPDGDAPVQRKHKFDPPEIPSAGVSEDGSHIVFLGGGSSTCLPSVESAVFYVNENRVVVKVFEYKDRVCTADFRMFKQKITRPKGQDFPMDVKVDIHNR